MRRLTEGVVLPPQKGEVREPWPPGWTSGGVIDVRSNRSWWTPEGSGSGQRHRRSPRLRHRPDGTRRTTRTTLAPSSVRVTHSASRSSMWSRGKRPSPSRRPSPAVAKNGWTSSSRGPTPDVAIASLMARGFELVSTHPEGKLVPENLARDSRGSRSSSATSTMASGPISSEPRERDRFASRCAASSRVST